MSSFLEARQSLIDIAGRHSIDVWLVFRKADKQPFWMWKLLRPGFQHVEVWKYIPPGAWLRFDVNVETLPVAVFADPPWQIVDPETQPTFIRVQRCVETGVFRAPFFVGPITCVELAKAFIGVGGFFIRTPYQLYKHLRSIKRDVTT